MHLYFRVEDENGVSPNLRTHLYEPTKISSSSADEFIANQIREEVNNCTNRSIFSYSKSLGVVLFKYNYVSDNPIHLLMTDFSNYVELIAIDENGQSKIYMPYSINDLDYPIKKKFQGRELLLQNYIIEVDDNILLDKYLKTYTNIGRKKLASCEKDVEVIVYYVTDDYVIREHIYALYLIYALQYKTGFLFKVGVLERLTNAFSKIIRNEEECNAFYYVILYLKEMWEYETEGSQRVLEDILNVGRLVQGYDGYALAKDIILNEDYESARNNSAYYMYDSLIEAIWEVFFTNI